MHGVNILRLYRYHRKILFREKNVNRLYSSETKNKFRNILKLHERGMFDEIFPDTSANDVTKILNCSPQCVYAGFDPTASSLHVGNLLILINLLHWQRGGHRVIIVLGGATGLIGDPSHREYERMAMEEYTVNENIKSIKKTIMEIFDNHERYFWKDYKFPLAPIKIENNNDWYNKTTVIEFVKNIGQQFRMGTMLNKTSVQGRLKSETGMSFTEFTYQIFQAYDWLYLFQKYKCQFQIGGSDQLGNISAGHELISRVTKKNVFGFTLPLITGEGGKKFGKSLKNAVWLSSRKSSSFQLYQFFIRTNDSDVEAYLKLFTFLPLPQIDQIIQEHRTHPEQRKAQHILAEHVTTLVHGEEGLSAAKNASLLLYDSSIESLSSMTTEQLLCVFENTQITHLIPDENMSVFDLAMKAKCFKNESDAARIINAGGFYINYEKVTDVNEIIHPDKYILPNNITLLRTGKKTYHIVQWMELKKDANLV
ncbi:PREDICTED: tyrosine--tRNA ligase, mitochondrial [Ceratosolen solmsi marchali]|uniref:Tyrosine--tRNA ligase n=1 Tax=Ceratosolen solmsi marchali TaxID=326594 RepID=A0AAJ7DUZ8_9HYME|nr:PREDICTED: tyrosine--tRNA ligase, mitochondrial [Ceratosolen solmsi marchali]